MLKTLPLFVALVSLSIHAASPESTAITIGAMDLLTKGKLESAEHMFYRALMLDPQNGVALHEAGKLLLKNGDKSSASDFFRRAEIALKDDASQAARYKDVVAVTKQNFPQAAQLRDALEEYRVTVERVVNANNNELVRETTLEKLKALGLEIKITAREQHLAGFASFELTQALDTPIGSFKDGASFLMNFEQPYSGVPGIWNNLKYNLVRFGQGQAPSIRVLKGGKSLILLSTTEPTSLKEMADFCKQLKAVKTNTQVKAGEQTFDVYLWDAQEGKTVNFRWGLVVCAAEMVLKVRR